MLPYFVCIWTILLGEINFFFKECIYAFFIAFPLPKFMLSVIPQGSQKHNRHSGAQLSAAGKYRSLFIPLITIKNCVICFPWENSLPEDGVRQGSPTLLPYKITSHLRINLFFLFFFLILIFLLKKENKTLIRFRTHLFLHEKFSTQINVQSQCFRDYIL